MFQDGICLRTLRSTKFTIVPFKVPSISPTVATITCFTGVLPMMRFTRQFGTYDLEEYDSLRDIIGDVVSDINNIVQDVDRKLEDEQPLAATGEEIGKQVSELPEYKFQFDQGHKALERSQAARGMMMSGNAMLESQEFGQRTAERAYSNHLQQLAQLAGISMPLTAAQSQTAGQVGVLGMQQSNMIGAAQSSMIQDIGRSRESAFIREGQTLFDAASLNAQMELQAGIANAQLAGGGGGGSSGGGGGGFGQIAGALIGGLF